MFYCYSSTNGKVNPLFVLTAPALFVAIAPCALIFLSNLSNTDEVALVANLGKITLAKRAARPISTFLPRLLIILPKILPRNPPD